MPGMRDIGTTRRLSALRPRGLEGAAERAGVAVRPAVEAALVAALAFGCAQAGWAVLTPPTADATASQASRTPGEAPDALADAPAGSPFAPGLVGGDAGAAAASATLANLQLTGVRMAQDADRSSAVITMADGAQRAFRIGDQIADGVTLAAVDKSGVTVAFGAERRSLSLPAPAQASFARAMLGKAPAPMTPARASVLTPPSTSQAPSTPLTPADLSPFAPVATVDAAPVAVQPTAPQAAHDWLARLVGQALSEGGDWRLPADLPAGAAALGMQPGDVIIAVNGADPTQAAAMLAAVANAETLALTFERNGERRTVQAVVRGGAKATPSAAAPTPTAAP